MLAGARPKLCQQRKKTRKDTPVGKQKAASKAATQKQKSPAQLAVQQAGAITGRIIGDLQNARKTFLRIGQLLTEVRDRAYYATLHHETMEEYADEHLDLSRRSLYRYMQVYAWALEHHKEWLATPTKVRIPDLYEIQGLVWIEQELARKNLSASRKAALLAAQEKALSGDLSAKELQALRRSVKKKTDATIARLIADTRTLRRRYVKAKSDAARNSLPFFDRIISLMQNDLVIESAGLDIFDRWPTGTKYAEFFRRNIQYS